MAAGFRWCRLDVGYFRNPKVLDAGRDGRDLHLVSICFASEHLTDGHIPESALRQLITDARVRRSAIDRAVDAGLWVPENGGFRVHDFRAMQPGREAVEREREQWRVRQQRRRRGTDGRYSDA